MAQKRTGRYTNSYVERRCKTDGNDGQGQRGPQGRKPAQSRSVRATDRAVRHTTAQHGPRRFRGPAGPWLLVVRALLARFGVGRAFSIKGVNVVYYSTDRFFATAWHLRPYEDVPLSVAIELAKIVTDACRWFHDKRAVFLGDPTAPAFPDEVVNEVCKALQCQLDKEGNSRTSGATCSTHSVAHDRWYQLMDLPPARRRAIVERIWSLKQSNDVTVRYWHDEPPPQPPKHPLQNYDYGI